MALPYWRGLLGSPLMSLDGITSHRPPAGAYHGRKPNLWLPVGVGVQACYRRTCRSAAGHWGSGSLALAVSPRRCGAAPYTLSGAPRFTYMLLSPPPFGFGLAVRLGVICPELRPTLLAILSVRTTAHTFAAHGSSRLLLEEIRRLGKRTVFFRPSIP